MIVYNVEDDLNPSPVESLYHLLKFRHLSAGISGVRIKCRGRKEVGSVVAPEFLSLFFNQEFFIQEVMHREKFDGGYTQAS